MEYYLGNSLVNYRNRRPKINYSQIIKEYAQGFAVMGLFLVALIGWQMALTPSDCSIAPHTGVIECK